jgi:small-conductance mechanosensitive channel
VFAPVDFSRVESALATPKGWADLGLLVVCLAIAWLVDRRVLAAREAAGNATRLRASVTRVVFPLTALALVLIAVMAYRRFVGPSFFLAIAGPMLIALAAIRMIVYGLRRLFKTQTWVTASERAIALGIWILVVLYFLGLFPEIVEALDDIVLPIGKTKISLLSIGTAIVVVVFTLIVTLWISGLAEQRLDRATHLDVNHRVVLGKFVRAVLLVVGVLIALQAIGFDLTLLSVFGGALGVGIGLGLQKLASNYIAGFTILIDRSIRPGDMVTVDNRIGRVSKLTSRYVVVRSLDGVEAIVPNETLVTTTVLNHTYSSRDIRLAIQVQVTYNCDIERALALMEEVARAQPRVLKSPEPIAFIASYGENRIVLELGAWIGDPENGLQNLRGAINREIFAAFSRHGICPPFPQRDVPAPDVPKGSADSVEATDSDKVEATDSDSVEATDSGKVEATDSPAQDSSTPK